MYVDMREKVYFDYFIELPSIKNSMSANFNDEEDGRGQPDGQEDSLVMTEEAGRDQAGDSLLHLGIHLGQPPPQAGPTPMVVPYYRSSTT